MTEPEKKSASSKETEQKDLTHKSVDDKAVNKKAAKPADKSASPAKPRKSTSSIAAIITLIFFVVIGTAGGLYLLWEEQQQTSIKQQLSAQNIDQQITTLKQQQLDISRKNEQQINEIHTYQENLRNNLTNLIRNKQHLRNDWLIAEAEYLVQLANHRLLLEKDVATATVVGQ